MSVEVRRIFRVGKQSSAVVLPSAWIKQLGLNIGDQVKLTYDGSKITVTPVRENELLRGQVTIEGADEVAYAKLVATFLEGIANVKLKADYESAVKLLRKLKEEIPSVMYVANPGAEYHTVVFPDVKIDPLDVLVKLCELFKKLLRGDGDQDVLLQDFRSTQLLLMRILKVRCYEEGLNVPEALDIVLFANTLNDVVDLVVKRSFNVDEEIKDSISVLVDQFYSKDLDTAVKLASNTIVKLDKFPTEVQKHVLSLAELIFRRCIRDRACRCRHFFPKI